MCENEENIINIILVNDININIINENDNGNESINIIIINVRKW